MERLVLVDGRIEGNRIRAALPHEELARLVLNEGRIVLLKHALDGDLLLDLRRAAFDWGRSLPPTEADDFRGNYHRRRVRVTFMHQAPHVFHDYNFNDFAGVDQNLGARLLAMFDPMRVLYNELTGYEATFGISAPGCSLHPQLIQYPRGGGFFGRHWHDPMPQKLGLIASMSRYGIDYPSGGTVFQIGDELVDVEGVHDLGDILVWRYDYHHWVTQSDLKDTFNWDRDDGRWIGTMPFYDSGG